MTQKTSELTPVWDYGRLNCPEFPRHSWEGDVEYYQRLARWYTTQEGIPVRNSRVSAAYERGTSIRDLAIDYGVSTVTIRKILIKAGGSYKVRSPVPEGRDQEILKRCAQKESYASIGRSYGITGCRVRDIWMREQSRIRRAEFWANRKESSHAKTK